MRKLLCLAVLVGLAALLVGGARGERKAQDEGMEKEAIKAQAEDFVKAFDKGDASALAAFWAPDGDYVAQAGTTFSGREAIEAAFKKQFAAAKGGKLRINTTSLRLVKPDLAIEDGTTEVTYPDGAPPIVTRYTAVHVKQEGRWFLASVRDAIAVAPSNHERLSDLDWLAGDWVDDVQKGEVGHVSFAWAENDNFLVATFATTLKDVPVSGGTQWIGWDGAGKQIRSWGFYSDGAITEGTWSGKGDKWTVKTTTTTRDGKKLSATNVITRIDADHATWQSTKRTLDGKGLPDTEVIKMKRDK